MLYVSTVASLEFAVKTIMDLKVLMFGDREWVEGDRDLLKSKLTYDCVSSIYYGACAARVLPGSQIIGAAFYILNSLKFVNDYHPSRDHGHYPSNYIRIFAYRFDEGFNANLGYSTNYNSNLQGTSAKAIAHQPVNWLDGRWFLQYFPSQLFPFSN